jgi:DNA adenine methylase
MNQKELVMNISKTFDVNNIYARYLISKANKDNIYNDISIYLKEKPKPFVKWVGGKRQLLKQFKDLGLYPPDLFNPSKNKYYEPFVGGGAVFFDLLPKNAVLSDLNYELVCTYNSIKNDVDTLVKMLKTFIYDKDFYLNVRSEEVATLTELEIASRFIYLNRTCFNGMYRVNSKGKFNVPFGRYNNPLICDEVNLRRVSESLQSVTILHNDYKSVLKYAESGDFIYFDPPYYPLSKTSSFTSYTSEVFLDKEQTELRDTFIELSNRGCFVMLSNSDSEFINEIYSGFERVRINKILAGRSINSNASARGKITEVLITNY